MDYPARPIWASILQIVVVGMLIALSITSLLERPYMVGASIKDIDNHPVYQVISISEPIDNQYLTCMMPEGQPDDQSKNKIVCVWTSIPFTVGDRLVTDKYGRVIEVPLPRSQPAPPAEVPADAGR